MTYPDIIPCGLEQVYSCCLWVKCSVYLLGSYALKYSSDPLLILIICLNDLSFKERILKSLYCTVVCYCFWIWCLLDIFRCSNIGCINIYCGYILDEHPFIIMAMMLLSLVIAFDLKPKLYLFII